MKHNIDCMALHSQADSCMHVDQMNEAQHRLYGSCLPAVLAQCINTMERVFQALQRQVVSCTLRTNDSAETGMTPMRIRPIPFVGMFAYLMAAQMHTGQMNEA